VPPTPCSEKSLRAAVMTRHWAAVGSETSFMGLVELTKDPIDGTDVSGTT